VAKTLFLKWVYSHISHAFYVGVSNRAYFKKYGLKDDALSFAPHAIDNERFSADRATEAAELRVSLNIGNDDILVLYAGKFEPVKNLDLLVRAFGQVENASVHLLLAGNGADEDELRKLAAESAACGRIHFIGFKNQTYMPVLYQASSLFCLPSKSESWGLAINEAMACGKAILASDKVGCAADLVNEGINGSVFRSGDVNDLGKKLQAQTSNKDRLCQMGKQSRHVIKNYSFLHIAEAIENKLQHETH
jgi:glycosyltransferase involved in cell wall biosynthesis